MAAKAEKLDGWVKFWNKERGWGFLRSAGDSLDYFVHNTDIVSHRQFKELFQDQQVEFIPVKTEKGWKAVKVVGVE